MEANTTIKAEEPPSNASQVAADSVPSSEESLPCKQIIIYETILQTVPVVGSNPNLEIDEVIIVGGDSHTQRMVQSVLQEGLNTTVRLIASARDVGEIQGKKVGCVNLLAFSRSINPISETFELYRDLARQCDLGPVFLVCAVSEDGAFGFDTPASNCCEAGALCGATKAFSREYPQAIVRVMDLHPQLEASEIANHVMRSLTPGFPVETGIAKNGETRVVALTPRQRRGVQKPLPDGDVILITGGARGIAAACAEYLATNHQYTFVLIGTTRLSKKAEKMARFDEKQWQAEKNRIMDRLRRQGAPLTPVLVEKELRALKAEAEVFNNISRLKDLGAEVLYRAVDISDDRAVNKVIQEVAELCGRIDLVIHAAGMDASKALRSKTQEQMMRVLDIKVNGMKNVLQALKSNHLFPKKIIGFGSVSGRFGNKAQVDYSAANDGLAHLLRWVDSDEDFRATTMCWAPWSEIGMAARGSVEKALRSAGIDFIAPQEGAKILAQEIEATDCHGEIIVAGSLGSLADTAFFCGHEGPCTGDEPALLSWGGQDVQIQEEVPGEYVRATVRLNPDHSLLGHHRIDRAYVLPGVGGLEIMTKAVARIAQGRKPQGIEKLQFMRPVKLFKDKSFDVEVEVQRLGSSEDPKFQAQISSWMIDKTGKKIGDRRVHHLARFSTNPSEDILAGTEIAASGACTIFIPASEIYDVFFHGPAFRFLDHVSIDEDSARVTFRFNKSAYQASMFDTDIPAGLEACFQACAAFTIEAHGVMGLPVGVERIDIFNYEGKPRLGYLNLVGQAEDNTTGRRLFTFDGYLADEHGKIMLRVERVSLIEIPGQKSFRGRVAEVFACTSQLVASVTNNHYNQTDLSQKEYDEFRSHRTPKRAQEWLAGRLAVKKAVGRLMEKSGVPSAALASIYVHQDDLGKPKVETSDTRSKNQLEISLSHSNGFVAAAASYHASFKGIGIDVEKVRPRSKAWVEDYFTDEEKRAAESSRDKWAYLTAIWSLKEASLKALGIGLRMDLQDVNVCIEGEDGRACIEFRNGHTKDLNLEPDKIEARAEIRGDMSIARVMIRN